MTEYGRDYGDENDFNDWVDNQFEEEDDFYFDPEYWDFSDADEDDDDGDEAGFLVGVA